MTKMLASVTTLHEAKMALAMDIDIIDLKQPALGALGALDIELIKTIVTEIGGACPISATIGDLPMEPDTIFNAVENMVNTGVDYVKIGFFPGGDWLATLQQLNSQAEYWKQHRHTFLIAVLFADTQPDLALLSTLKNHGFSGAMLDTMNKQKGSLSQLMTSTAIGQFVKLAKHQQLLCGLAGSLKIEDIAGLLSFQPDYLGFRGALCNHHDRTSPLNQSAIFNVKQALMEPATAA